MYFFVGNTNGRLGTTFKILYFVVEKRMAVWVQLKIFVFSCKNEWPFGYTHSPLSFPFPLIYSSKDFGLLLFLVRYYLHCPVLIFFYHHMSRKNDHFHRITLHRSGKIYRLSELPFSTVLKFHAHHFDFNEIACKFSK